MKQYGLTRDTLKRWQTNKLVEPVGSWGPRKMNVYLATDIEAIMHKKGLVIPGQPGGQEALPEPETSPGDRSRCVCGVRIAALERELADSERGRLEWRAIAQRVMNNT